MREFVRRHHFLLRRLHSLAGVVPVGLFLVFHLFENSRAIQGAAAYNEVVLSINSLPFILFIRDLRHFPATLFSCHLRYLYRSRRTAQRLAVQLRPQLGFPVAAHHGPDHALVRYVPHLALPVQKALGVYDVNPELPGLPSYNIVADAFASPAAKVFYFIGIVAAAYHFANGLYTFLITWGITIGPRSQRVSSLVTNLLFVLISAMGLTALFAFRL